MGRKEDALVVVAIDFGTTYSGYAYSFRDEYKKDHKKIYSNDVWRTEDGFATTKTPTTILFGEDGEFHSFGYEAEQTYTELIESGEADEYSYFTRFKMKLFQDESISTVHHPELKAGIDEDFLTLAYEPEAAAIYCKEATVQRKEGTEGCSLQSFDAGHQFLVLDCGGGTIDVTSYEVQNDSELKELSEPSGGPWGGTFVDQEYESFLKDLFGKDVWETYIKQCPEDFLDIKRKFEAKKRGIKESQKPKTTIPYPQSLYQTYCKIRKSQSFQEDLKKSVHCKTVTATNEKLRYEPGVVNRFFLKSVDSIISHVQSLLTPTLKKRQSD